MPARRPRSGAPRGRLRDAAGGYLQVLGSYRDSRLAALQRSAQSAELKVNGTDHTSESNTVTDAIAGITLTLKATTASTAVSVGAPGADSDKVKQVLEDFVEQYNSTVTFIRAAYRGRLNGQRKSRQGGRPFRSLLLHLIGILNPLVSHPLQHFIKGNPDLLQIPHSQITFIKLAGLHPASNGFAH